MEQVIEYMGEIRGLLNDVLQSIGSGSNFVKAVGYAKLGLIKTQEIQLLSTVIRALKYFKTQVCCVFFGDMCIYSY